MSGLGELWDTTTPSSSAKLNLKELIVADGDYIQSADKTTFKLAICTEDSTDLALTEDHIYEVTDNETTLTDISVGAPHTHAGDSSGGPIFDIYQANPKFIDLQYIKVADLAVANWRQTLSGTASVADDTDGTTGEQSSKLLTGATSGSGSTIRSRTPMELDFSKRSMFQFKVRLSATTDLAMHCGIQADLITDADSNTQKYNAEVCTATNTNWHLRTASGSDKTSSDTGTAFTTNRVAIRLEHYPDLGTPRVDMYIDAGSVFQKTTHIPTTGSTGNNNIIVHSLKNSASADKNAFIYGSRLRFYANTEWI